MAAWHAEAEVYHRGLIAAVTARAARQVELDQEATLLPVTSAEIDKLIERDFGLPSGSSDRSEGHRRFQEAQARRSALAGIRSKIQDDQGRRSLEYHARQADHDAALARKYQYAASRPWLSVEPESPKPGP
jgi:hypothetical protein